VAVRRRVATPSIFDMNVLLMEADLVFALPVPAGALREGENLLAIVPPKENDDIVLSELNLDPRPFNEAVHEATLAISVVRDTDTTTLPCRLTIADAHGALAPLLALANSRSRAPLIAVRPGVVYTGDRQAQVGLPAGDYTIYAARGFEYSVGDLATNLGPQIRVTIKVLGPSWVSATNVALYANGIKIRETGISIVTGRRAASSASGEKAVISWSIERPAHDVYLIAIATGPAVEAPFWRIPRPYQPASPHWEGRVIGSTNPIWLDADGDGQFTSARAYAQRLIAAHGADAGRLLPALGDFDEAIAARAASLCVGAGVGLDRPDFAQALKRAAPQVRRGFAAYAATLAANPPAH
jgi:hypothetical protein